MSVEILRRAASLMRERAEDAVSGPWATEEKSERGRRTGDGRVYSVSVRSNAEFADEVADTLDMADARHIASWHPAVALAVADWLDQTLEAHLHVAPGNYPFFVQAVNVARAYLGESA